ncbi:BID domain-containing T4SS effector [Bartonella sp. B23]
MKKSQTSHFQKTLIKKPTQHHSKVFSRITKSTPVLEENQQNEVFLTENVSTAVTSSMTPLTEDEKTGDMRQEKSIFAPLSSRQEKTVLSEEQITRLIPHNKLENGFRKDIYQCCQIVYGNKKALQKKIKEIQCDPAVAEDLSWQIALNPGNFSKLAGTNICGIKNEERRNAEKSIVALCEAISQYGIVVKYARDCLSQFPNSELKRYEKLIDHRRMDKILQSRHHSEREKGPLSNAEVLDMIQRDSEVKKHQARVRYWSKTIFGNQDALQKQTENLLQDPSMKEVFIQQLEARPQSFHKLSGTNVCGIKNKSRTNAEASLSHMLYSVSNLANAVEKAKESILQSHQEQQRNHTSSIKSAKDLHKQQDLSENSECSSVVIHHGVSETSKHTHKKAQSVQPRKAPGTKALTLAN